MADHDRRVSQLDRDLRFFPVATRRPRVLDDVQITRYNAHGYLPGIRAFAEPAVSSNRKAFDEILDQFLRAGKGSYAIDRYQDRWPRPSGRSSARSRRPSAPPAER